jgi:hypothetical protein
VNSNNAVAMPAHKGWQNLLLLVWLELLMLVVVLLLMLRHIM